MWLQLLACAASEPSPVHFVRDGIVRGGQFTARQWAPGDVVDGMVAPRVAECVPLFSVGLGDASSHVRAGGEAPDTAIVFSPDERWLAIGTFDGLLLVVDAWTGALRGRAQWSEALIKRVAWSPDGSVLWIGEQSPDGFVYALRSADLAELGRFRLADELGGGEPPESGDLYARYALPGVYGLVADAEGAFVVGAHGWTDAAGIRHNRSRVWRLALGEGVGVTGAWPPEGPADAVFSGLALAADVLAVPVRRSAAGPAPEAIPVDGVALLDRALAPRATVSLSPLLPWFTSVFVGDGVAVSESTVWLGLGDGRVVAADRSTGEVQHTLPIGVPEPGMSLPLAATVGWVATSGSGAVAVTTRTVIPYGAASPELRPPRLHPAENAVVALAADGEERWRASFPHNLQGLVTSDRWVVVGAGGREADDRRDLFGALVLHPETGTLAAICPTPSPVFFRPAMSSDGRIALAEVPFRAAGGVAGEWRVTVMR